MLLLVWFALFKTVFATPLDYFPLEYANSYFEQFIVQYNRNYVNEAQKQEKFANFLYNLKTANDLNAKSHYAHFGVTKLMDMDHMEFVNIYPGPPIDQNACPTITDHHVTFVNAPESFDWREHNGVTPVKNQGSCKSCYAFSAIGNIESQFAIKHKEMIDLSEQQIVECDRRSTGCSGGSMSAAFKMLLEFGGAVTEAEYPYTMMDGLCKYYDDSHKKVQLYGCYSFQLTSQELLKQILFLNGPISVANELRPFVTYNGGIITENVCNTGVLQHGVLLVGYGTENGMPYWILKNSWGADWAEGGYFRIQRGEGTNACSMMNAYMSTAVLFPYQHLFNVTNQHSNNDDSDSIVP